MKKKQNAFFSIAICTLLMAMLACSYSPITLLLGTSTPTATPTPTITQTPTPLPSPTPLPTDTPEPIVLKVVSSLPMQGSSIDQTQAIVNAIQLRLDQANYRVCNGRYEISYEAWDDSGALGKWDPKVEVANANKAVADPSIIAYLGTFNSGAAKLSIPILNQAGPLVMISPANTYPGLTKNIPSVPNEPEIFYPTGIRNYARVSIADDVQGATAARYLKNELGLTTVYVLDDGDLYGIMVANTFETTANEIGLTVLGHKSFDPNQANYRNLMDMIATSNHGKPPDAIFAGMVFANNGVQLLTDKVAIMGNNEKVKFMGPDGILVQDFINEAGSSAEGIYATVADLPFEERKELAKQFIRNYEAQYGNLRESYALYGYEAMNALMKAIENVCAENGDPTNREAIRAAVFSIEDFNGILGTWSLDENGDISLSDVTIYQVHNGQYYQVGIYK